jgi:Protein of unknown function (DUF4065)
VGERAGYVNKTKLLKLLYLADIEHYRNFGETLTGFDWLFYLFGPWASEYDLLLEDLVRRGAISLEAWGGADREGARIDLHEGRELTKVIRDTGELYLIQHQIDTWNDRSLPELLDYVYFQTEPMSEAVSGEKLQFEKVVRESPKLYLRKKSETHPEAMKRLKAKMHAFRTQIEAQRQAALKEFRPPVIDEVYLTALAELEEEESRR